MTDIFGITSWDTRDRISNGNPNNDIWLCDRGSQALAVSVVFTGLATCFVSARVYTRRCLIKHMQPNDWMVVVALIFSFIFMSFFIMEAIHGMGIYQEELPQKVSRQQLKSFYLTIPFYNTSLFCAKASILLQYHRVFPTRPMRLTCALFLALLAVYGTWAITSAFLTCIPVQKFWEPISGGHCLYTKALWFSNACMHIFTDLAVLVIPIPALKGLGLPLRQRVGIIVIFALGGFVCITSIIRLLTLNTISESTNPTHDNVGAATWSAIECNTGIICACLPTLRPLISKYIPGLFRPSTTVTTYEPKKTRNSNSGHIVPFSVSRRGNGDNSNGHHNKKQTRTTLSPNININTTATISTDSIQTKNDQPKTNQSTQIKINPVSPPPQIPPLPPAYYQNRNFFDDVDVDVEAGYGFGYRRYNAITSIHEQKHKEDDDEDDELEEERMLAFVQQKKLGCRWSKGSSNAGTMMTTTTLRGDERWSSVSSGQTLAVKE